MNYIGVTIISENNDGKRDVRYIETDKLLSAVRITSTFKPKRGYKVIKVIMEEMVKIL